MLTARNMAILGLGLVIAAPCGALTSITKLPFTVSVANETYQLSADLVSDSGAAITVAANGVKIDGQGKSITYGEYGQGNAIVINHNVSNVELTNLRLVQGAYSPTDNQNGHAIRNEGDFANLRVISNEIIISRSGMGSSGRAYGLSLSSMTRVSTGNEISSNRMVITGGSGGRGVSIDGPMEAIIRANNIELDNMSSSPAGYGRAISVIGGGKKSVLDNTIHLTSTATTAQGLSFWNASEVVVSANIVQLDGRNSRGILIDGGSSYNEVRQNQITLTQADASQGSSAGVVIRYGSHHNVIAANSINAVNAVSAFGIRLGGSDASYPTDPYQNKIVGNIVSSSSRALSIEDGSDYHLQANTWRGEGTGYAIYFYCGTTRTCKDSWISGDQAFGTVRFNGSPLGSKLLLCATNVTSSQVVIGVGRPEDLVLQSTACDASKMPLPPGSVVVQ